ncbi:MAG: cysteine desulfurase family protein [Candidatus Paceibacterota bacterium]
MQRHYFDYASTTPVSDAVKEKMNTVPFGNPGSLHEEGRVASELLQSARKKVANALKVKAGEVVFTHGGTDANMRALLGVVKAKKEKGVSYSDMEVVVSRIEHASILNTAKELLRLGVTVHYVSNNEEGIISPSELCSYITEKTVLVSIGYVNNEIGTIQPVRAIATKAKEKNPHVLVHTDACQSPLYVPVAPHALGVDLLSLDAQKIYGPKGVGVLFVRQDVELSPLVDGTQERGIVPGTEALPLIVGMSEALSDAVLKQEDEAKRIAGIRDELFEYIEDKIPGAIRNGSKESRVANNINISLLSVDTEYLVMQLDARGFAISTKSTCERDMPYSHVVKELGGDEKRAYHTLRISLGRDSDLENAKKLIDTIVELTT